MELTFSFFLQTIMSACMVMVDVNKTATTLLAATTAVVTQDTPNQAPTAMVRYIYIYIYIYSM